MVLLRLGRIRTGPLGFPRGEAGRLDGSSEPARLTEEGWRQPKYCLHAVQWYQREIIADSFTTWRRGFIKQVPISTHRTLHKTFGARHPSSVTPRWGAPAIGSRYDCHRQPLLLKDSLRSATPPGEAKGAGTNSPWVSIMVFCVPQETPPARCAVLPFQGRLDSAPRWGSWQPERAD